jgi:hypothetical protein
MYGSYCTRCAGWVENAWLHGKDALCQDCHSRAISVVGTRVIPYVSDAVKPYTNPKTGAIVVIPRFVPVTVIALETDAHNYPRLRCQTDDGTIFVSTARNLGADSPSSKPV